jgi:Protein of unknown function (DUF2474)
LTVADRTRRLGWFVLLWCAGAIALGVVAFLLRMVLAAAS